MNRTFKIKAAVLCVPGALGFLIFYILPFIRTLGYSAVKSSVDPTFVGLENYK